jgi:Kef-type K+ transport system membrane component KefB
VTHFGHPWVIAVLLSTSSASIAMPILRERDPDLAGKETSAAAAWILFADLLTVMVLPIVGGNVTEIPRMVLSSLALAVIAGVAVFIMTRVTAAAWWQHTRSGSKANQWGWDLRIAMLLLFGFSTMASMWGASALIAGFTAGVVMNLAGPNPYRLGQQLVGIGDGFLIPVFFVVLGARLDVNAFTSVELWALVGLMLVGTVVVHVLAARLTRQDLSVGLLASAQMGVPAAITTIGVSQGWLSAAQGTAFMTCALLSVGVCSLGAGILHRAQDAAGFPSAPAEL